MTVAKIASISILFIQAVVWVSSKEIADVKTIGIYVNVSDCGDGEMSQFVASVSPYPLLFILPTTLWIGGHMKFTEEARKFLSNNNVTEEIFARDLKLQSYFDTVAVETAQVKEAVFLANITCIALHDAVNTKAEFDFLVPEDFLLTMSFNPYFMPMLQWTTENADVPIQVRLKATILNQTLLCVKLNIRTQQEPNISYVVRVLARQNFRNAFVAHQVKSVNYNVSITERQISYRCPPHSSETEDGTCACAAGRAGPYCMFLCDYNKMVMNDPYTKPPNTTMISFTKFAFNAADLIDWCVRYFPIINGSLIARPVSLGQVDFEWSFTNMYTFTTAFYGLSLLSESENVGVVHRYMSYYEGMRSKTSLTTICPPHELFFSPFGCNNCPCPPLKLRPFTTYTAILRVYIPGVSRKGWLEVLDAGNVTFTSNETKPENLTITDAVLENQEIAVEWSILECPGVIYELTISITCSDTNMPQVVIDAEGFQCFLTFFRTNIPCSCSRFDHITIQMRARTTVGYGGWSNSRNVTTSGLTTIAIIGIAIIAVLISVFIGTMAFCYYYRNHVKTYQGVYKTILNLVTNNRRSSIVVSDQNSYLSSRELPAAPDQTRRPEGDETAFQPTPDSNLSPIETLNGTAQTSPRNERTRTSSTSSTFRDSLGYKIWPDVVLSETSTNGNNSLRY